jgi:hypothetical protein
VRVIFGDDQRRFWLKVNKDGPVPAHRPELSACWVWTKVKSRAGYGFFRLGDKQRYAHCVAFEWAHGPVPAGLELDHLCRNTSCVNPSHLEPVTGAENKRRGTSFSAVNGAKTHCLRGHLFDAANTHVTKKGGRVCRRCATLRTRERRRRRRAAA